MVNERTPIPPGGLGVGMRVGMELVMATMIGTGLGWLGDRYFGTKPIVMVIGVLIGVAAGLLNVHRYLKRLE